MDNLSASYLNRAEIWLLITMLCYFLMNGAQIFETAIFVPKWTNNPPQSFMYLIDKNGLGLKGFWIIFHSIHETTFILAIIFCWKIPEIRNILIILFIGHFMLRVWTLTYFAPNVIEFQHMGTSSDLTQGLLKKTTLWQNLNYVRVGAYILISVGLIPLLLKIINMKNG